jgi:hypothetical protein
MCGCASFEALLTVGPRLTGGLQTSDARFRVDTHRSFSPSDTSRFDHRNNSRPSRRIEGRWSFAALLNSGRARPSRTFRPAEAR